jgi:TPP-dependent pyruvate/acetoin dehydrogenase alpha subunit
VSNKEIEKIEKEIEGEISDAIQFAEKCTYPDPEEAMTGLYSE